QEKQFNWAAQLKDRAGFVRQMLANLPDRPAYFAFDVALNLKGAPPLSQLPPLCPLTGSELQKAAAAGAVVLDTRHAALFGAGHFPGSLNIGFGSAMFATWSGFFVPGDSEIILVVSETSVPRKARLALARIGFDRVPGFVVADDLEQLSQ